MNLTQIQMSRAKLSGIRNFQKRLPPQTDEMLSHEKCSVFQNVFYKG